MEKNTIIFNRPFHFQPVVPVKEFDKDIAVPDLSFNIREIMENFGKGLLDINVLKAQCRDELHLSTGVYDLADYSDAIKQSISNYDKAVADRERILSTLAEMQNQPQVSPPVPEPAPAPSADK